MTETVVATFWAATYGTPKGVFGVLDFMAETSWPIIVTPEMWTAAQASVRNLHSDAILLSMTPLSALLEKEEG